MGMGVGCVGLSIDDFCKCDIDEFEAICRAWSDMLEAQNRDDWEQMRLLAAVSIQPHVRKRIIPRQLIPLPWDNQKVRNRNDRAATPALTPEQRQARFKRLARESKS